MPLPNVLRAEITIHFPDLVDVGEPLEGGQKLVFPCTIRARRYVLKLMLSAEAEPDEESDANTLADEALARAQREVAILRDCDSPHLPKLGPLEMCFRDINGQHVIAFSEEYVNGENLHQILEREESLTPREIIRLARHINAAIAELWKFGKIHRDIKPSNIMRQHESGIYVLLDPGIAFDVNATSLTAPGALARTPGYIAPEMLNPDGKREGDCRADHFLLGIVMYECATGIHPFTMGRNLTEEEIIRNIMNARPPAARDLNPRMPEALSKVIERLLQKRRHARFRNCTQLDLHLAGCERNLR